MKTKFKKDEHGKLILDEKTNKPIIVAEDGTETPSDRKYKTLPNGDFELDPSGDPIEVADELKPQPKPKKKRKWLWWILLIVIIAGLIVAAVLILPNYLGGDPKGPVLPTDTTIVVPPDTTRPVGPVGPVIPNPVFDYTATYDWVNMPVESQKQMTDALTTSPVTVDKIKVRTLYLVKGYNGKDMAFIQEEQAGGKMRNIFTEPKNVSGL